MLFIFKYFDNLTGLFFQNSLDPSRGRKKIRELDIFERKCLKILDTTLFQLVVYQTEENQEPPQQGEVVEEERKKNKWKVAR